MGYFGSKATSGLCQPIIAMMPPHDTYIETHLGGGAIMRRKLAALRNIGIDRDARALDGFECDYAGVAVHDCWASYLSYAHCDHALCGAHLLRELAFIVDAHDYAWAKRMKRLLLGACHQVSKRDDNPTQTQAPPTSPLSIPSFNYQMTPKISLNTRCSISISENLSINGQTRSSDQLGIWSYNINP